MSRQISLAEQLHINIVLAYPLPSPLHEVNAQVKRQVSHSLRATLRGVPDPYRDVYHAMYAQVWPTVVQVLTEVWETFTTEQAARAAAHNRNIAAASDRVKELFGVELPRDTLVADCRPQMVLGAMLAGVDRTVVLSLTPSQGT